MSRSSHQPQRSPVAAPRKRTADVRAALVDAAWWVLEHDGLAGLTVRAVATRAGVAPMGVYNHLRDKNGLLTAVLTRGFDEFSAALAEPADLEPVARLLATGRAYRAFALAHPVAYGLMFGGGGSTADLDPDPEHPHPDTIALSEAGERAFGRLVSVIAHAQAAGVVRADPLEQIAWTVWSAVHGAVSLELAGSLPPTDTAPSYEAVLEMILRGIAPG
ncbi:TetR/AcrR family transcriptional regulator [Jatrophihabitans sp. YIM 134969]